MSLWDHVPTLNTFFCYFNLRTGCILIGIFSITNIVCFMVFSLFMDFSCDIDDDMKLVIFIVNCCYIFISIVNILLAIYLLMVAFRAVVSGLICYLYTSSTICIVLLCCYILDNTIMFFSSTCSTRHAVIPLYQFLFILPLSVYFILTINSYRKLYDPAVRRINEEFSYTLPSLIVTKGPASVT